MAGGTYTSNSIPFALKKNAGGLNSTYSPPNLEDNESSDLLNIDFDKSGAFSKRNGYTQLNTTQISYGGIDTYTKFLCHCDGTTTTFIDSIGTHTITNVGPGATQSATQSFFGGKAGYFDGNNDYIYMAHHEDFDWSAGIFTFDSRLYYDDAALADGVIFYKGTDANNYMKCMLNSDGSVTFKIVIATVTVVTISSAAASITPQTWYHFEVSGDGTKYYMFINGAAVTPVTDADKPLAFTLAFNIGSVDAGGTYWKGYIDEIRISKGICRHTADFVTSNRAYNAETTAPAWTGLTQFNLSTGTSYLVGVCGTDIFKMDAMDGTWDNITGGVTITTGANYHHTFSTHINVLTGTNGVNLPWTWSGTGYCAAATVPTGLTVAKFTEVFSNYTFYGNCTVSGVIQSSRIYWSAIDSVTTWTASDYRNVSQFDGREITGVKTLGNALVIFKITSIWIANFTGDSDIPFTFTQTRSNVGCIAPQSIQEVENGIIFLSYDGFYYFDGNNSTKFSQKIVNTVQDMSSTRIPFTASAYHFEKNRYITSFTLSGNTTHDRNIVWDSFNNAFSVYKGIAANCFARVYSSTYEEDIYFGDYSGYVYKMDTGDDDYPLGTKTAIEAYYYTKWFDYGDLISKKANPQLAIYHQYNNTSLTLTYSYNYALGDQYSQAFSIAQTVGVWPITWGVTKWVAEGGAVTKRHLTGRGEVVRFGFKNNVLSQPFIINGFAVFAHAETNVK